MEDIGERGEEEGNKDGKVSDGEEGETALEEDKDGEGDGKVKLVVAKIALQKKPPLPKSTHTSPTSHGSGAQGSMSNSHNVPDIPGRHTH